RSREMLPDGGRLFEAPRWHDGRWYVSDFHRHVVQTLDEHGSAEVILEVPEQPSGLGWLPDGSLLVVSMRDHRLIRRWPDGRVTQHADVSRFCGGFLNDMVVDRSGRASVRMGVLSMLRATSGQRMRGRVVAAGSRQVARSSVASTRPPAFAFSRACSVAPMAAHCSAAPPAGTTRRSSPRAATRCSP